MNAITNTSEFVIDVNVREINNVKVKNKSSSNTVFEIPSGRVAVVYNQYNPESLLAAAILKNYYPEYKYVSFQEVISSDLDYVIWTGVNKINPTGNVPWRKTVKHLEFDASQPVLHEEKKLSIIDKLLKNPSLTVKQDFDNRLVKYLNGAVETDIDYHEMVKTTIIDKILVYFNIEDTGLYGYRYLSIMSDFWYKDKCTDEEAATFHLNMNNAYCSLKSNIKQSFRSEFPTEKNIVKFKEDRAKHFKLLENKTVFHTVPTVTGYMNVAVLNADFETHYVALRYFKSIGMKYLGVLHGVNGGFFTGNVKLRDGFMYSGINRYIDC